MDMHPIVELVLRDAVDSHMRRGGETPFDNGWNAAVTEWRRRETVAMMWYAGLSPDKQRAFTELCMEENLLFVVVYDDENNTQVLVGINLNDVFCPAADGEVIPEDEFEKVLFLFKRYGMDGPYAWAAHKQNIQDLSWRKIGERVRFQAALGYLKDEEAKNAQVPDPV